MIKNFLSANIIVKITSWGTKIAFGWNRYLYSINGLIADLGLGMYVC